MSNYREKTRAGLNVRGRTRILLVPRSFIFFFIFWKIMYRYILITYNYMSPIQMEVIHLSGLNLSPGEVKVIENVKKKNSRNVKSIEEKV